MSISKKQEVFIRKVKDIHGSKYDYSKIEYTKLKNSIIVTCRIHGDFNKLADSFLYGKSGCTKCMLKAKGDRYRWSNERFEDESRKIHGDRYEYDKVSYIKNDKKVVITCKDHGDFTQAPVNHLQGHNCPECHKRDAIGGYSKTLFENNPKIRNKKASCYIVKVTDKRTLKTFIKVGITANKVKYRYSGNNYGSYKIEIIRDKKTTLHKAFMIEQRFLKMFKKHQYFAPRDFYGWTECFKLKD